MIIRVKVLVLGCVLVCLAAGSGFADQQAGANNSSLADIARQIKAQKAKEPKPARVMTNDSIGGSEDKASFSATSSKKPPLESPKEAPGTADKKHGADYFHSAQSKLQDQLALHKRELDVLQQKLGQNQTQFYPNPQDSLMQQYSREDINKRTAEINAKKQQIDDDQKAMDDLHEQLRREGGDPSWLTQ